MPGSTRKLPVWLPILVLLIAMSSIQSGASMAKSLFPLCGALGVHALRLALETLILIAFSNLCVCGRKSSGCLLLFYGLSLGGMNYLFYLSIQTVPLAWWSCWNLLVLWRSRCFHLRRAGRFYLGRGCAWAPGSCCHYNARYVSRRSYWGRVGARRWRLLSSTYRPASRRGTWSGHGGGIADCRHHFRADWRSSGWRRAMALVDSSLRLAVAVLTALPYSLEMIALTRLPTRTFGTLMSMEPALAAVSGMIFLAKRLRAYKSRPVRHQPPQWVLP